VIKREQIDEAKQKMVNKILADITLSEIVVLIIEKAGKRADKTLLDMSEKDLLKLIREDQLPPKASEHRGKSTIRGSIKGSKRKKIEPVAKEAPGFFSPISKYFKNLFSEPSPPAKKKTPPKKKRKRKGFVTKGEKN
jgi:hypothetical protein